jgi:uncharacterized protein DUF4349
MTDAMDTLVAELRGTAPSAPSALCSRVEAIAAREPARSPTLAERIRPRRLLLIAAPTGLAVMLGVAVAHGLSTSGGNGSKAAALGTTRQTILTAPANRPANRRRALGPADSASTPELQANPVAHGAFAAPQRNAALGSASKLNQAATPPPAKGRAQDYSASLTVRVGSLSRLSEATKVAIRATRAWGGYVVAANYAVPGENGDSTLTLKVPVQHVQAAIQRFGSLGTLAAQDVSIRDVQGKLDSYTRDLLAIRERIAKIQKKLARTDLTAAQRADLELQLVRARRTAANLRAEQTALARTASFATIALTLTTREAAAAAPHKDGQVERTLRDAASVLALELAFLLYGLIVVAPLTLLAGLALLAARVTRRRADDRLLGRT